MVHAADATGIVVINQVKPVSVLFSIPEDKLPQVLARMRGGASLTVEAWNRDKESRIATGRLTASTIRLTRTTGTVKLKAHVRQQGWRIVSQPVRERAPAAEINAAGGVLFPSKYFFRKAPYALRRLPPITPP